MSSRPWATLGVVIGANQPSSTGLGGGNSEIIKGRCAERQLAQSTDGDKRPTFTSVNARGAENLNPSRGRSRLGALLILISVAFALFCLRMRGKTACIFLVRWPAFWASHLSIQHFGLAQSVRASKLEPSQERRRWNSDGAIASLAVPVRGESGVTTWSCRNG